MRSVLHFLGILLVVAGATSAGSPRTHAAEPVPAENQPKADEAPTRFLRQIMLVTDVETAAKQVFQPDGGYVVVSPSLPGLDRAELTRRLSAGENAPITDRLLVGIVQVVEAYARQMNYPIAAAVIPPQNIADGVVRVAVYLGKIRNISFQGGQWFSEKLLREKLRMDQGRLVNLSEMDQAINWTNNNPFRRINVQVNPVPGTAEADLVVAVQDQAPVRLAATADNSGNPIVGRNRYTASLTYGNLWGRDHIVSYQHITSNRHDIFRGHGFDYRAPLPWRHTLQFSGSYLRITPSFYEGLFEQVAENLTGDLRYLWPLQTGQSPLDASFAINFKESNNNLAFGGTQVLSTKVDTFLLTSSISKVIRQAKGIWVFSGSLSLSPGEINERNSLERFRDARLLAKARYATGTLSMQRLQALGGGWELSLRGLAQLASTNLLSNEQLNLGGASTVRGFGENVISGDQGFTMTAEMLSPTLRFPLKIRKDRALPLDVRGLLFWDAGRASRKVSTPYDPYTHAISSLGTGARVSLDRYLSVTLDYGWQLVGSRELKTGHQRLHLRGTLSY